MINSMESDRLQKLIDFKRSQYMKKKESNPDDPALKYINSEVALLAEEILPIILENTTFEYRDIRNFITRIMRKAERHPKAKEITDLRIHIKIKDPEPGERPVLALASTEKSTLYLTCSSRVVFIEL
jgi:hypothetical protein